MTNSQLPFAIRRWLVTPSGSRWEYKPTRYKSRFEAEQAAYTMGISLDGLEGWEVSIF